MTFEFRPWGGARRGAGRRPASPRPRVSHAKRGGIARPCPVHVTLRLRPGLPSLRETRAHAALQEALRASAGRDGFRVVEYAAQSNHVHLVCEAHDQVALSRGIQGLCVRVVRAIHRAWRCRGRLFADRFHQHALATPREVRNVLAYVLGNASKHGIPLLGGIDPYSSAAWFDGWAGKEETRAATHGPPPVAKARTWLLAFGWRRSGLLPRTQPS